MKRIFLLTVVAALMLNFSSIQAVNIKKVKGDKESVQVKKDKPKLSESEIQAYVARVDEINKMDKSNLTAREKRELRKELRDIKDKVNKADDGIYIGGGVLLVIIIVLLVLLL